MFATHQEPTPGSWSLEGARIHNLGLPRTAWRALRSRLGSNTAKRRFKSCIRSGPEPAGHWPSASERCCACRVSSTWPAASWSRSTTSATADVGRWRGRLLQRAVLRNATRVTAASDADLRARRRARRASAPSSARRRPTALADAAPGPSPAGRAAEARARREPQSRQGSRHVCFVRCAFSRIVAATSGSTSSARTL